MSHDEMIAVIQAHKEGKKIQARAAMTNNDWRDTDNPFWDFHYLDYRVSPEPREWWVTPDLRMFAEQEEACSHAYDHCKHSKTPIIRVREVLE